MLASPTGHILTSSGFPLLPLYIGQILGINFAVAKANFLTTLCSYLDVTWTYFLGSSLFNVNVNYSCSLKCIEINLVNYDYFGGWWLFIFKNLDNKWVASVLNPHVRRRCTTFKKSLVLGIVNSHGLAWAKWIATIVVFHRKGQSRRVVLFSC